MRTHAEIINEVGIAKLRAILAVQGFDLPDPTVRSWGRRGGPGGSIPAPYWRALARSRVTSLSELAEYAETRVVRTATDREGV